jgi:hypothetical protein
VTDSAFAAEKAYIIAIERIESHNIFADSTSMSPLVAAPAVIANMAILSKLAGREVVAGLEIESQDVRDYGNNITGTLPLRSPFSTLICLDLTPILLGLDLFPQIFNTVTT